MTGLSVVNVGDAQTVMGQSDEMFLLPCSDLGFITFATLAVLHLALQHGLKQQVMAQESIGQTSLKKVSFPIKAVFLYALFFEAIGTLILTLSWLKEYSFSDALFYAAFYSVSAFNNGGFSL